jgi:hypothetical protein
MSQSPIKTIICVVIGPGAKSIVKVTVSFDPTGPRGHGIVVYSNVASSVAVDDLKHHSVGRA